MIKLKETVYLQSNNLQIRSISASAKNLGRAQNPLNEASNTMVNIIENHYGAHFMWEAADEVGSVAAEIDRIADNLESLKAICSKAPEEIEDADKGFRDWNNKNYSSSKSGKKRSIWDALGITWILQTVFGIGIAQQEESAVQPVYNPNLPVTPPDPIQPSKQLDEIHDYEQGVERGTIRYCNQNPTHYSKNGWDDSYASKCGWHCNRASESMAFSYIGVDVSPVEMEDAPFDKYEFAASGVQPGYSATLPTSDGGTAQVEIRGTNGFSRTVLDDCVTDYINDDGKGSASPVMLHYDKTTYDADGNPHYESHWIDIIGKNEDGSYMAIGPWSNTGTDGERVPFRVYIDDSGVVSGEGFSGCSNGRHVSNIGQYVRLD